MLASTELWLGRLAQSVEDPTTVPPATTGGVETVELVFQILGPVLGTGLVGSLFLMLLFRIKIMPTYVYDQAVVAWQQERERLEQERVDERVRSDGERARLEAENGELKSALKDANKVYTEQVIPTLTRVLDAERELVDLRRDEAAERRRRGQP